MQKGHSPYPPEYKREIVELVRSGRTPEELAREFEPSAGAIRNWVRRADLDEGRRNDGLTSDEREELRRVTSHEHDPGILTSLTHPPWGLG